MAQASLEEIVQRMINADEPEEAIASVIQGYGSHVASRPVMNSAPAADNQTVQPQPTFTGSPRYNPNPTYDQPKEPDTYWGGFFKGAKDYLEEITSEIPAGLESLAHPQTTGDFLNLIIPSELPRMGGSISRVAKSINEAPEKPYYNPLPADKDNIAAIAEAINKPPVDAPRPSGIWDANIDVMAKPATLTDDKLFDLAREKHGMGLDNPEIAKENPFQKIVDKQSKPTAEFLGMQPDGAGGEIPLFNVKGGPKSGSTVTLDTLNELGIEAPEIPTATSATRMSGDQMRAAAIAKRSKEMDAKAPGFKGVVADFEGPKNKQVNDKLTGGMASLTDKDIQYLDSFDDFGKPLSREDMGLSASDSGSLPKDSYLLKDEKTPIPTQQRGIETLLSDERGMAGLDINAPKPQAPIPEKPFARFDPESGTFTPLDRATGQQTGPAQMPGKELAPEFAAVSKYARTAKLANETQKKSMWAEVRDANRAALTAFDLSAPGRQGKALMMTKAYWTSFDDMFKSWGSQRAYDNVMESIVQMPEFKQPKLADGSFGKSLAERGGLNIAGKDEVLNSNLAEKLLPGVKASERAYSAFLSKLRADHFRTMVNDARKMGMKPDTNDTVLQSIGDFINDATGRGSLGKIENPQLNLATGKLESSTGMKILNELFFAPKLMASRLNMYKRWLDPRTYGNANPVVRKQAIKSLLSTVGFGLAVGELASLAGAQVSNDPTNSDFRKIKVGENTRIDPFSGFQQYAVGASRFLSGEAFNRKNPNRPFDLTSGKFGMPTRASVTGQFFQNKLAPIPSLVWSWMEGRDFDGLPFEAKKALLNRTVPIVMQDLYELAQEDPKLLPLGILPIFGEGLQTYGR